MKALDNTWDGTRVVTMKRRGVTGKLATVTYLARVLGCSRQTALSITHRAADFPEPIDVLNDAGPRGVAVYWREEVDRWVVENPDAVQKKRSQG